MKNHGSSSLTMMLEVDALGNGKWKTLKTIAIPSNGSVVLPFTNAEQGEWIRIRTGQSAVVSASFVYADTRQNIAQSTSAFAGISKVNDEASLGGLLVALGDNKRKLGLLANASYGNTSIETGYYEMDSTMKLLPKKNDTMQQIIREKVKIPSQVVLVEASSYLIVDGMGRRWRLPKTDQGYNGLMERQSLRICREVATERDLFNCGGTFYELPSENADGFAKIKPVSTHGLRINDYASFRGLLVLTGIDTKTSSANRNIFYSDDRKAAVWAGVIDDLWKMGKPVGKGGPWLNDEVAAGAASDPYLFGGYDKRTLILSHQSTSAISFTLQLDATGDGVWYDYKTITVSAGQSSVLAFPADIQSKWVRVVSDKTTVATAQLEYK